MLSFMGIGLLGLFICAWLRTPVRRYTGTVVQVSGWDGQARLKTTTTEGRDTIVRVRPRRNERFVEGQVLAVWTGGDLTAGIATTNPQE